MISQKSASIQFNNARKIAPPGPPALPFVGVSPFLKSKYLHLDLLQLSKKYGNIFQIHVGGRKVVVLHGLETIKEALVYNKNSCNGKADFGIYQIEPMNFFMEAKSGEPWENHHSIAGQVLHNFISGQLDIHESWVMDEVEELTKIFTSSEGQPVDPNFYLPLATLSFMQRLIFNKRASLNDLQKETDFVKVCNSIVVLNDIVPYITKLQVMPMIWKPIYLLFHLKSFIGFFKELAPAEPYFGKLIEEHRESFDPENLRNMTDGLLKVCSELTESDLKNLKLREKDIVDGTLFQFVAAGGQIPSLMVRWALLYMIAYPEIQAEIEKEIDTVVGRGQKISFKDRSKLPFTEACIHEIFRHSSNTVMPPFVYGTNDDVTLSGYFIPKNTVLFINYYSLTRDERYWEEPEEFNPYRFLDENGKLRNNLVDKFYPFGIGSRRCIGEYLGRFLIFTLFTNLMHKCKFEKVPGEKLNLKPQPGVMVRPKDYRIVAKPRF